MKITDYLKADGWLDQVAGPRYVQLRKRIEKAMDPEVGILPPGASLPSEREIASLTGLSRVTVRNAIQALVESGTVIQRQGSGTFVTEKAQRVEQSLSHLTSFSEDMTRRGMKSTSVWLERSICLPSPEETIALALSANDSVSRISRLRMADDRPMAIERAALPVDILPNPIAVTTSLYDVLEQDGNRPVRAIQKISAINLGQDDADLLGVAEGAAGLRIERVSYLPSGRVAEFTKSIYRGDAYDFVAELRL
ncbi:GntR family transcriptional regulator [Nioella sediminis]|jgi:GntR family transcriptional regulator|uniref:GntR family transcriptional regulator n=1 Tax=Nioella sediminis TaxID=1912092 RepID=UPI0008FD17F1|nr:GntR family transcriptional regulator [Nioella sediminis]TBX16168.1 phage tail protein [Roseovarius sp. JS7-11]